jgi:PhzF family phenazine biosynthesis protein
MKRPLYWLDAFTSEIFRGNPAAVVPLDAWLPDALLQKIAFENGLSETAFFIRTGPARFHLRWFTPAVEVDLCGHATLASGWTLFHELDQMGDAIIFDSRSGPLTVAHRSDGLLELDFPSRPAQPATPTDDLLRSLGRAPQIVEKAETAWLCVYASANDVTTLSPDHAALARVTPGRMIVTAPGSDGVDFVSRFFAPDAGIAEDPVTGSAHCTLAPYWAKRLDKAKLHARQVSSRGGELFCEPAGDRVKIAGRCVLYLRGEISV